MHAFLYTGSTENDRIQSIRTKLDALSVASYDRVTLIPGDKPSIGIEQVRAFTQQLYYSSHGPHGTAGIIPDAGLLTAQAQQALLKTIEEPPPQVTLHIGSSSETQVLSTIASRCQIIRVTSDESAFSPEEIASCTLLLQKLRTATAGHVVSLIQSIGKTRDDTKRWIDCAIVTNRTILRQNPNSRETMTLVSHIHGLLDAKNLAANNVSPIQLLEHIFLQTTV